MVAQEPITVWVAQRVDEQGLVLLVNFDGIGFGVGALHDIVAVEDYYGVVLWVWWWEARQTPITFRVSVKGSMSG